MATLQTQIISLVANLSSKAPVMDMATSQEPQAWWACDLQIRASAFSDAGLTILSVANLTSATLYLKDPSNLDGSPLFSQTLTEFDNTTTAATWNAGTNQHMLFTLPADDLSFGGLTNGQRLLDLVIVGVTTGGKTAVLCVGTLALIDSGADSPSSNPVNAITVTQAAAMVAAAFWTQGVTNLGAAGTTLLANGQTWGTGRLPFSLAAGAGAYVVNITLSDANVLAGALVRIPIDFPASANPTVNIYDGSTAGNLLEGPLTNPNPGQAASFLFTAGFDGTNFHKESGMWVG